MKAVGVVAEYNPFHNGHAYQIKKIREQLQPDVVVIVMSGNFLQRGEPAIVDKWTRAKMALKSGADLIIELPTLYSVQAADYFARGSIQLFKKINIDTISFGVEDGKSEDYLNLAEWTINNKDLIDQKFSQNQQYDMTYPQQMERILDRLIPMSSFSLATPNNHLGLAYTKEIIRQDMKDKISIFPIRRKDANYLDKELSDTSNIASATAIRKAVYQKKNIDIFLPENVVDIFKKELDRKVSWENYFPFLKYKIISQTPEELNKIYEMNEGLEYRLKKHINNTHSFSEYMDKIKTKRYTQVRLQRLLIYVLLNLTKDKVSDYFQQSIDFPLRILGFTQAGRRYLNKQKEEISFITNINKKTHEFVEYEILAGNIYRLGNDKIKMQDFIQKPINIIDN